MANTYAKITKYATFLDELFARESLTSDLTSDSSLVTLGANANEIVIPSMTMDGLAEYNRSTGYSNGDVKMTKQTVQFNYDRGRMFTIDAVDNEETAFIAFGNLASEFLRTKVVPEADAFTFSTLASTPSIISHKAQTIADGKALVKALSNDLDEMDNAEVPMNGRILYLTPTMKSLLDNMQLIESQKVLSRVSKVVVVPQSRFYTAITLKNDQKGGYEKTMEAEAINYMIVNKVAVMKYDKHVAPKVVTPQQNQNADAWRFGYRKHGLVSTYANKVKAIAVNSSTIGK